MRAVILGLWVVLMGCVVVGRLQVSDKVLHFGAYLGLAMLPVMGAGGVAAGLSMFVLGVLLEEGQHWAPGRAGAPQRQDLGYNGACQVQAARRSRSSRPA